MREPVVRRLRAAQGLELAADVGGDPAAAPVILLHGGGQTRHSWGAAMHALLDQGLQVINLDARGHGDSDWSDDGRYHLTDFASDLEAVIATLSSPPALVGASMGGAAALYVCGMCPQVPVRALVLVDIVARINSHGSARIRDFMHASPQGFANLEEASRAVAAYNPHRPPPRDPEGLMKNLRMRDDGRLHWHWDPRFMSQHDAAEPPDFGQLLEDASKRVRVPTLLVRGLKSEIVDDAGVDHLRGCISHLEVVDIRDAGHMVAGDRNDVFNDAVIDFLRRHP